MGDVSLQLPALFGLWAGHHIAGTGSADLARRYAALAETQSEAGPRARRPAHARPGALLRGPLRGIARADRTGRSRSTIPIVHRDLTQRFGHDPRAGCGQLQGLEPLAPGLPRPGRFGDPRTICGGSREVDHANTTGLVLCFGTMTHIWLRQPDRVEAAAREALRLAEEMTLPLWHAWASIHLGWALSQQARRPASTRSRPGCARPGDRRRPLRAVPPRPRGRGVRPRGPARRGLGRLVPRRSRALARGHHRAYRRRSLPPPGRPVVAPGGGSSCRGRGGPLPSPGDRPRAGIALPGAARRDQPRPAVGRAGRARPRRATCSPRSSAGSPRASIRRTSRTPRRCSTS